MNGHDGATATDSKMESGNREEILRAAAAHFLENGYHGTTIRAICKTAKVSKPTLYYYSKSKRNPFFMLRMEAVERDLRPHVAKASSIKDPLERLKTIIRGIADMMCTYPELRVFIHETAGMKGGCFDEPTKLWKEHYCLLRETIAELQDAGAIPDTDRPSTFALLALGMLAWIPFWYDFVRGNGGARVAEGAVHLILNGLLK